MELQGKLIEIGQIQEFGSNGFTKREFVIETQEQYPQTIKIELLKDKTSLIDNYSKGDVIKVSININGRRWEKDGQVKYFNSIVGWRIVKVEENQNASPADFDKQLVDLKEDDSLPF